THTHRHTHKNAHPPHTHTTSTHTHTHTHTHTPSLTSLLSQFTGNTPLALLHHTPMRTAFGILQSQGGVRHGHLIPPSGLLQSDSTEINKNKHRDVTMDARYNPSTPTMPSKHS